MNPESRVDISRSEYPPETAGKAAPLSSLLLSQSLVEAA